MSDSPRLQPPGSDALLGWLTHYRRAWFGGDLTAGLVLSIMVIPQSMAYAMLAGMPVQVGLYASLLPLLGYALFGSSMSMSVGPVAVTATLLAPLAEVGSADYMQLAIWLALFSGALLFAFGLLRLGFLANFLSHPVISGFISGAAILIVLSQVPKLAGLRNWPELLANLAARLAPILVVVLAVAATLQFGLSAHGVPVVGEIPAGLPSLVWQTPDTGALRSLLIPAVLISLVTFVESVSIAQSLARRKRQSINPDRELLGLGAANLGSGLTGGFAVAGGFSRSSVNIEAGANTPLAGVIAAVMIAGILLTVAPLFAYLPQVMLAVVIIVAVVPLIDLRSLARAWRYDRAAPCWVCSYSALKAALFLACAGPSSRSCGAAAARTLLWWAGCRTPTTFATPSAIWWKPCRSCWHCALTKISSSPIPKRWNRPFIRRWQTILTPEKCY